MNEIVYNACFPAAWLTKYLKKIASVSTSNKRNIIGVIAFNKILTYITNQVNHDLIMFPLRTYTCCQTTFADQEVAKKSKRA